MFRALFLCSCVNTFSQHHSHSYLILNLCLFRIVKSSTSSSLSPTHAWDITPLSVSNVLVLLEQIHRAIIWFISSLFKTDQICLLLRDTCTCLWGPSLGYTTVVPVVHYRLRRRGYLWRCTRLMASWRCWTDREVPDSPPRRFTRNQINEITGYL